MEYSVPIKDEILCFKCNELLPFESVSSMHETIPFICGRCDQQPPKDEEEEDGSSTSSSSSYASTSSKPDLTLEPPSFSCRFSEQGCTKQMPFSEEQTNTHERDCPFRTFVCPVVSSGSCEWVGLLQQLSEHCRERHSRHFHENPGFLALPNLTQSNLCNYLVSAFNFLFLVSFRVCTFSGKLIPWVRRFGDSRLFVKFSYLLEIEGNDFKVEREGSVLRPEMRMELGLSADSIEISSLLYILSGKFIAPKFTITIICRCLNCLKSVANVSDSKLCDECEGKLIKCEFHERGCLFVDVAEMTCKKHERFFCKYQTECSKLDCRDSFLDGYSLFEHFLSSKSCRKTIKSNINSVVRLTETFNSSCIILFSSNNIGTIKCEYILNNYNLYLYLSTSLPSYQVKHLKCSIELTDLHTKRTQTYAPQNDYIFEDDWMVTKHMHFCKNVALDMIINIDGI